MLVIIFARLGSPGFLPHSTINERAFFVSASEHLFVLVAATATSAFVCWLFEFLPLTKALDGGIRSVCLSAGPAHDWFH